MIDQAETRGDALVQDEDDQGEHLVECADCGETYDRLERGADGCPSCGYYGYRAPESMVATDGGEDLFALSGDETRRRVDLEDVREEIDRVYRHKQTRHWNDYRTHLGHPDQDDRSVCEGYVDLETHDPHPIDGITDWELATRACVLCLQRLVVREQVSLTDGSGLPEIVTDGGRDVVDEIDFEDVRKEFGHIVVSASRGGRRMHLPSGAQTETGPGVRCREAYWQTKERSLEVVPDSYLEELLCQKCAADWLSSDEDESRTDEETRETLARGPADVLEAAGFDVVDPGHAGNDPEVIL